MDDKKGFLCKRIGGVWTLVIFYCDGTEKVLVLRSDVSIGTFEAFARAVMSINH